MAKIPSRYLWPTVDGPVVSPRVPECLECGASLAGRDKRAEFCGNACRKAWNNRRLLRGAELVDVVMAGRFERADNPDWMAEVSRLASAFRDADKARRNGRRSWAKGKRPLAYGREGDQR